MFQAVFLLLVFLVGAEVAGAWQAATAQPKPPPQPARSRLSVSARRNENVAVNPIDNNAIKEANIRLGSTTTIVSEPRVEASYYATEFGRPSGALLLLPAASQLTSWHAELFEWHQNSVFNTRTFFQVGDVLPSHRNQYGGRFTSSLGRLVGLTATASQRKVRGMVNGNVLVPLAAERTPRATDPVVRAIVTRWLAAYPTTLPNRPDFDIRALNTNAPQRIDDVDGSLRLDRSLGSRNRVSLSHTLARQHIEAFQLVAGQNPNSDIHTHRSQASWRAAPSAHTDVALGFTFQRARSVLVPEPNAVGQRVRMGYQIEELGPDSEFPINRAANSFRAGGDVSRRLAGGSHTLTFGGDVIRFQLNGIETHNQRGYLSFTNNFGRSSIENFLLGAPSYFEITIGELARGFRNRTANVFISDRWKVTSRLQLYLGLRYNLVAAPNEVNGLNQFPYGCDCNNFSPRFAIAWQALGGWTVRTSYSVSFGEIQPVTYQQIRNNPPLVRFVQIQNPDLLDPLRGLASGGAAGRTSPTLLASDLVSPYAHQYNFSLERKLGAALLRLGYTGSRSFKFPNVFTQNRAEPTPGIPLTLDTVDRRRPDPRFYEVHNITNGGIGYFDAAQASVDVPLWRGLRWNASYSFGKAIDQGSDFSSVAANRDLLRARSQWQYDSFGDKKSLSTFDSTHALVLNYSWDLPKVRRNGWVGRLLNDWQAAGVHMIKSGTPLTLFVGSDAPGFGNVDGGASDRPNILDPSILGRTIHHPDSAPLILRRDRFGYIRPGEVRGNVARNSFRKAGIANWNAALTKQWHWGGPREWTCLLRAEVYNLANTPQFDEPQRNYSSPAFGKITNTLNDGRVFQLGLRLLL